MKKFLLLSVAAGMAFGASAELIDITPAGYNFADPNVVVPHVDGCAQGFSWNPAPYWLQENPDFYNEGCILWIGDFASNYANVMESCGIVDLGGNIGRVFYINRPGSEVNEALNAVVEDREIDVPAGSCGNYLIPLWHCDPEVYTGDSGVRVRIVLNIYQNNFQFTGENSQFQPYFQSNTISTYGDHEAEGKKVYSGDFTKRWGEVESEDGKIDWATATQEDVDPYTEDDETYEWNYNRWMVYEFDLAAIGEGEAPWKIKMELPGGPNNGGTLFIKEIKFLAKDGENDDIELCTRRKGWEYYDVNASAIASVIADKAQGLAVSVNGNEVSFGEAAAVYSVAGALVAQGQNVTLEKGFYVATANGKSVKFAVK